MKKEKLINLCSKKELKDFIKMAEDEIKEWVKFLDICHKKLKKYEKPL